MKGKKLLLAGFLHRTNMLQFLRGAVRNRLMVFNYHRINGVSDKCATAFDDGVFGPTAKQFEQQMIWLKRNSDIISEKVLLTVLENGRKLSNPSTMVTFDDGYIDNYTLAYPILKKHNIPAIFFIPTEPITNRQLGWWDIIAFLIKKTRKPTIFYDNAKISLAHTAEAIKFFLNKKALEPKEKTKDLLVRLSDACDVPLPDSSIQNDELMTWDQIREVSRGGIVIGSHTHSHTVLSTIPFIEQKREISMSKTILERELGCMVNSLSYPVGNYQHFSIETQLLLLECGYKLGFSFNTGVNYDQEILPYDIKRVESEGELEMLAAMTLLPSIFAR